MASPFEDRLLRGYEALDRFLGQDATYVSPNRATSTAIRILYVEQAGFLDPNSNALYSFRTADATIERGGRFVLDSITWEIVDVRDSEDGTGEARCIRPDLTP